MAEETAQSSSASGTTTSPSGGSQSESGSPSSQAGQTTQQTTAQTQATSLPPRPEYVPESFWDAKAGKITDDKALSEHFNQIIARDAAEQSRKLSLPEKPDAYKVELPADFKPPEGVEFKFNDADPLLAQARTMAHEMGISQEGFSKLLGLYAGSQIASQQAIANARNAEIAKLGTTGPARITALDTFFKAQLGEAEGRQFMSRVLTASDVAIAEKLVAKITNQGVGNFRGTGREAPEAPGRKSAEEIAKMSPAQRLDYSRSFDQSKMPPNPYDNRAA